MKASELIATLQAMVEEHGDLPVYTVDYGCCDHVEIPFECDPQSIEINVAFPAIGTSRP